MASSNNVSTLSEQFFEDITSSFFGWIWDEFLPILILILFLIVFAFGIFVNVILLVVSAMNRWHREPVHAFVIQLCVSDLIACALVVLPTLISVRRESSAFPDTKDSCNFQHFIFTLCLVLPFFFITIGTIERTVRAVGTALYIKYFGNPCFVILVVVATWLVGVAVSLLTLVKQELKYDEDLFHCVVRYETSPAVMHFLLAVWYYLPTVIVVTCFVIIFYTRSRQVKDDACSTQGHKGKDFTDANLQTYSVYVAKEKSTSVFYINQRGHRANPIRSSASLYASNAKIDTVLANDEVDAGNITRSHRGHARDFNAKQKWKSVVKRVKKQRKIARVFRDKPDDINHHQSITYLLTWAVMTMCWSLYVIALYVDVYSGRCSPCLRVGVLLGQSTYSCKPLIYIGHNRWYRATFVTTVKAMVRKRKSDSTNRSDQQFPS